MEGIGIGRFAKNYQRDRDGPPRGRIQRMKRTIPTSLPPDYFFSHSGKPRASRLRTRMRTRPSALAGRSAPRTELREMACRGLKMAVSRAPIRDFNCQPQPERLVKSLGSPIYNDSQALDYSMTMQIGSAVYPLVTIVHYTKGNFNGTLNVTAAITTP